MTIFTIKEPRDYVTSACTHEYWAIHTELACEGSNVQVRYRGDVTPFKRSPSATRDLLFLECEI
jgi:hypothetical protein